MRILLTLALLAAASTSNAAMMIHPSEWVLSVGDTSQTFTEVPGTSTLTTAEGSVSTTIEHTNMGTVDHLTITTTLTSIGGAEVVSDGDVNIRFLSPNWRSYSYSGAYIDPDPANTDMEVYVRKSRLWPTPGQTYLGSGTLDSLVNPVGWRIAHTGATPTTVTLRFTSWVPEPATWLLLIGGVGCAYLLRKG